MHHDICHFNRRLWPRTNFGSRTAKPRFYESSYIEPCLCGILKFEDRSTTHGYKWFDVKCVHHTSCNKYRSDHAVLIWRFGKWELLSYLVDLHKFGAGKSASYHKSRACFKEITIDAMWAWFGEQGMEHT